MMTSTFIIKKMRTLLFGLIVFISGATATSMQIFTISQISIFTNYKNVTVCYLDQAKLLTSQMNQSIRKIHANNYPINLNHLKKQYSGDFKKIGQSMVCQYNAKELGIKKLPAIVFDHQYVVYGVRDIDQANQMYLDYKEQH